MRRYNYIFDGTLKAGHDFTYKYDPKDPFRLLSVDAKEYRSSTEEVDTTRREHSYAFDGNGNLVLQLSDLAERIDSASFADTAAMQVRQYLWDEDNHLLAINDNGFVSNYFYDAAGERTVKISAPDLSVFVNGAEALKNDSALVKFVGYVSPYLVVSNGGRYTKHIYAGTQRIASKVGDIESVGADPRRVEYAGANFKEVDFGEIYDTQTKALLARYDSLGVEHRPNTLNDYVGGQSFCCGEKEFEPSQTGKDEFETSDYEQLIFFYHPDHLGSTSLVTDNSGNVVQSVAYIPYGEVFIEERNGTWNTPYLFNGKELDEETGLYYYGARYLNPTNGMWLSTDPLFEKYVGMSPYNYCAGNPVKLVDPDGRRPVYNEEGILIGVTEDSGLQGDAVFMDEKNYSPKMTIEEISQKDQGKKYLIDDNAISNYENSFKNLSKRPDWDGYLTLDEANQWYRNGNGSPLYVSLEKINLDGLISLGEEFVGEKYTFNLLFGASHKAEDGLVYGNLTFKRYPNDECRAFADVYDFDYKSSKNPLIWIRNFQTYIGNLYAGDGKGYTIFIYGSKKLKTK
ncbi:MAG: RHS repeat-associated core domain-containing protein [Paludibacteraceae bacterium]|nr:RHS repeat-associated core domain-containing protein [Paludibacteraceae bacterium]